MVTDVPEIAPNLTRDSDRLKKVLSMVSGSSWVGSAKENTIRRPQRDSLSEPLYEKDIESLAVEYDYASDLSRNSRSVINKVGSRVSDDGHEKQFYGAISRGPDLISDQRDGLHAKSRIPNYATARLEYSELSGPSRKISVPHGSWKNSEVEEFMWDMHSRLSEPDVATINPKNELQASDESERLEPDNQLLRQPRFPALDSRFDPANKTNSYSSNQKDPSMFGRWTSSPRYLYDSEVFSSIGATSTAASKGIQHHSRVISSGILPNSGSESDRQSPLHDSTSKQNVTKQDVRRAHSLPQRDPRASRLPVKSHSDPRDVSVRLQSSSSQFKNTNMLEQPDVSQLENFDSKSTAENAPGLTISSEATRQLNISDLLEGVMKSGILSNNSSCGAIKEEISQDEISPRAQTLLTKPKTPPLPISVAGDNLLARLKVEQSSAPVSCTASLAGVTSAQTSKENSKATDPISCLLSSLVSKGLISASKTELPSLVQCAASSITHDHSPDHSTDSSMSVSVVPAAAQPLVLVKGTSSAPKVKELASPFETTKSEPEYLIGLKFRADKIRELHPSVLSSLFDDLPHLCISCGTRLKQKEELDRHMELHDKKSGTNSKCKVWFPKADYWIAAKSGELEPEYESEPESTIEDGPAVTADENQCACILCGVMFEDYYSQEMAQWMFRGTSYLTRSEANGPIVHAGCLTKSSLQSLEVRNAMKQIGERKKQQINIYWRKIKRLVWRKQSYPKKQKKVFSFPPIST